MSDTDERTFDHVTLSSIPLPKSRHYQAKQSLKIFKEFDFSTLSCDNMYMNTHLADSLEKWLHDIL